MNLGYRDSALRAALKAARPLDWLELLDLAGVPDSADAAHAFARALVGLQQEGLLKTERQPGGGFLYSLARPVLPEDWTPDV
jgi:hypothetical protein